MYWQLAAERVNSTLTLRLGRGRGAGAGVKHVPLLSCTRVGINRTCVHGSTVQAWPMHSAARAHSANTLDGCGSTLQTTEAGLR